MVILDRSISEDFTVRLILIISFLCLIIFIFLICGCCSPFTENVNLGACLQFDTPTNKSLLVYLFLLIGFYQCRKSWWCLPVLHQALLTNDGVEVPANHCRVSKAGGWSQNARDVRRHWAKKPNEQAEGINLSLIFVKQYRSLFDFVETLESRQ